MGVTDHMRTDAKTGLIAAVAGTAAWLSVCAVADDVVGIVKRSHGAVTIERGDTQSPATPGVELYRGDRVVTDADAYAELRLRGAPPLRVGPEATVAVDRFAAADERGKQRPPLGLFEGLASLFTGFSRHR